MKKTWIIPQEAVQSFRWMFLDGFDVFKSASKRECVFLKSPVYVEEHWKEKNILEFKTSKAE